MPPILISIPDEEHSFVSFPEGTSDNDIRVFLGTQRAEQFPLIAEEVAEELDKRAELQSQLTQLQRLPSAMGRQPRAEAQDPFAFVEERTQQAQAIFQEQLIGVVRGAAGALMLNQEVAEEEFGERVGRLLTGDLTAGFGAPTLPEIIEGGQIGFQRLFGNPKIPLLDVGFFPSVAAPLVDPQTGEPDNSEIFRAPRYGKAINAGLRQASLPGLAAAGLDAILPPDQFGSEFEPFVPDGQLERTAMFMATIFGTFPEFFIGGAFGKVVARGVGVTPVGRVLRQQLLDRFGSFMGALGFAGFSGDLAANQIELGTPGDLDEAMERVSSAAVAGVKGLATGAAVVAAQTATAALIARAIGIPAGALPMTALQSSLLKAGDIGSMTVAFGSVPPLMEGQPITAQGMFDAFTIMATFGIGESILTNRLARQVSRGEPLDLNRALTEVLAENNRLITIMPPQPIPARTRLTPQNASKGSIPDSQRLPGGAQRGAELTPETATISSRFEAGLEQQQVRDRAILEEARPDVDLDAGLRALEEGAGVPGRPAVEPGRPEPTVEPPAEALGLEALRDRKVSIEAEFRQEVDLGPETISAVETRMGEFRKFQEQDLARKRGPEEQVPVAKEVEADLADLGPRVKEAIRKLEEPGSNVADSHAVALDPLADVSKSKTSEVEFRSDLLPEGWTLEIARTRTKEGVTAEAEVDWPNQRIAFSAQEHLDNPLIKNHELAHVIVETNRRVEALYEEYIEFKRESPEWKERGADWIVRNKFHREEIAMELGDHLSRQPIAPELQAIFEKFIPEIRTGASVRLEPEALTPIQEARAKAPSPQDALESLVRDLDAIEAKASPEAVQEATARASDLSGEAVALRQAEARNLAEQIVARDYFPAGESITQIIAASTETGTIRVRTRNNEGTQETIDIPIAEGPIRGVSEFIEADRLVDISVQAAIAGRRAGEEQSGLIAKAKDVLVDQLRKLGEEEAGAFLFNPFSRKPKRPKAEPDEYLPPDVEQPSRDVISRRKSEVARNTDQMQSLLRRTGLTPKQRADLETRLMRNREELNWLQEAADAAPFATVDPRAEFNERPVEDLRAQAKEQKIPAAEAMTKERLVEAMVNRRSEATGQARAPIAQAESSARAERKMNEEISDANKRATNLGQRLRAGFGKAIDPTHRMKRDFEALMKESPEAASEAIRQAFFAAELIRTAPATGLEIYRMRFRDIWENSSRTENDFMDKVANARRDLAQRIANPELKGRALEKKEAEDYLKQMQAQDPVAFADVNARIDDLRDLYNEALEAQVEIGLVSRESADNMLAKREYLPIQFAELADSANTGIGPQRVPGPGALRKSKGGFEIELPNLETATIESLRGFARANALNIPKGLNKAQTYDAIRSRVNQREARVLDTRFLAEDYFRKVGRNIQRQRAMLALEEILTALPDNGIIIGRAEVIRGKGGSLEFAPLKQSGINEIIPFRKDGELAGLIVNKQFADAFELRGQGSAGAQAAARALNNLMFTGTRKTFWTGPGAPLFWMVAFLRDFTQLGFSKPTFRDPTFGDWFPGVTSARIALAMARVSGDVFGHGLDGGPIMQSYRKHGGLGAQLTRFDLVQRGREERFVRGIEDVSAVSVEQARRITRQIGGMNERAEMLGRLAEYDQVARDIAKQKGIPVERRYEDLSVSDLQEAAYAANSRMDLSARTITTHFLEAFEPYTVAHVQSLRSAGRLVRDKPVIAGARALTLLSFGAIMYSLSKASNEQATKDMPSHLKRDIVLPLPDGIGTFADEDGNRTFSAIRIPVDQNLAVMQAFGWEIGAYFDPEGQVDWDNMTGSAAQILKFRGQSSIGFLGSLFVEQFTNRSLTFKGKRLYQGREGGLLAAEIDPENTSPAVERIARIANAVSPNLVSPERLQESLTGQFGNSLGLRLFANAANLASGIPDLRPEEKKAFWGEFLFDRVVKKVPEGGAGFRNQQELQRIVIAEENNFRTMFGRTLLRARARNDGVIVEGDTQLISELEAIVESPHKNIAKTMIENQLRRQALVEVTRFPRIWESILNADADVAAPRYYNFLLGLTAENRVVLEDEMKSMVTTSVKSTEWWDTVRGFINRFQPDFEELVESGILDAGVLTEALEEELRQPVPDPGLGRQTLGRQTLEETPITPQQLTGGPLIQSVEEAFPLLSAPAPPR